MTFKECAKRFNDKYPSVRIFEYDFEQNECFKDFLTDYGYSFIKTWDDENSNMVSRLTERIDTLDLYDINGNRLYENAKIRCF